MLACAKDRSKTMDYKDLKEFYGCNNNGFVRNVDPFECSICFNLVFELNGVVLRECLHQFCENCLSKLIARAESDIIKCPYTYFENEEVSKCDFKLQDREVAGIRALKMEFQDLSILYSCDNMELVSNLEPFECPICLTRIPEFGGVVLRECLHEFCKDCLVQLIRHADEANINCPYICNNNKCEFKLEDREIRCLADQDTYDNYLERCLRLAEMSLADTFHCLAANCKAFYIIGDPIDQFQCSSCNQTNCLTCKTIHEANGRCLMREKSQTEEQEAAMIQQGVAQKCPHCKMTIIKNGGCNHMTCAVCKKDFTWNGYQ